MRVTLIGTGTIAAQVLSQLAFHTDVQVTAVVRPARPREAAGAAPTWGGVPVLEAVPHQETDLVVEMASDTAITQHVVPALNRGIPCLICSVGALAAPHVLAQVLAAARSGGTFAQLITGAVGAIDALAAAAIGGLHKVHYTGRKPPLAWLGTPAAENWPLADLACATVVFQGDARDASLGFPKNANVASTVALAGIGFDQTEVTLIADPAVDCNVHHIVASGAFGRLEFTCHNTPSPDNPRTSGVVAYSVTRAILNQISPLRF